MSDSRVVGGLERLPWLSDEPVRQAPTLKRRSWNAAGLAIAAVLLVAVIAFWLGSRVPVNETPQGRHAATTVPLPEPRVAPVPQVEMAPQPQVSPAPPPPEVRIVRVPEIRIIPAPTSKLPAAPEANAASAEVTATSTPNDKSTSSAEATISTPKVAATPLRPWQPREVAGAAGRIVQIGAFGSVTQAKQGWRYMVRSYPAVAHLPAVVRPDRNSRGRAFYRFRVGTTSQAHSEVLCQRMEKIRLSCAVVGLPWKAKVER
jgi:hypothetical protein